MTEDKNGRKLYDSVHGWLRNNFKKSHKCENKDCAAVNPKKFDWALIKGKTYEKKRENFIELCRSCHKKYDYTEERRAKMKSEIPYFIKRGKKFTAFGSDNHRSKEVIDTQTGQIYETITKAAGTIGVDTMKLRHMLVGRMINRTNFKLYG